VDEASCVAFLQWALPQLAMRPAGFRRVRGQVCKRLRRRLAELALPDLEAYRDRLEAHPDEWLVLGALCVVTISRFYRDAGVWDALRAEVLPALAGQALAAGGRELRCWSIGCASGEEPYTLSLVWSLELAARYPGLRLRVLATDLDERLLARARRAEYPPSSLAELPASWRQQAFEPAGRSVALREPFRAPVAFERQDVRVVQPPERFRVIFCRNVAFTYFDDELQRAMLERLSAALFDGGALVIGKGERLPAGERFRPWPLRLQERDDQIFMAAPTTAAPR
jgi:chemotaxis protein methyltransferase CheR